MTSVSLSNNCSLARALWITTQGPLFRIKAGPTRYMQVNESTKVQNSRRNMSCNANNNS